MLVCVAICRRALACYRERAEVGVGWRFLRNGNVLDREVGGRRWFSLRGNSTVDH